MIRILTLGIQFFMLNSGQSKAGKSVLNEGMDVISAIGKAMKDKKILEEDKEKKPDMWKKLMKKEEMKFLDEIASIGFANRTRNEQEELARKKREEKSNQDFQ